MFFKGMSFGFMARNGWYSSPAGQQEIQNLIASGADSVALMVTIMQDAFYSTRMYRDFEITPSDDEVRETIRTFHQAGLKVMLKPILEMHDSCHRGDIRFPPEDQEQIAGVRTNYWAAWFRNYTAAMVHYARLCEKENVEMLLLGCEYTAQDTKEEYWPPLIEEVRKVYRGLLAYNTSSWWDFDLAKGWMREWFRKLDMLGVSHYCGVPAECNTPATIAKALQPTVDNLEIASRKLGIPIFIAEMGCRSVINGHVHPADCWSNHNAFDGEIQQSYMDGTFRAFSGHPWWTGFFWWKWEEQQNRPHFHHPTGDTGCTIAGKPAAKFFHDWKP